MKQKLFFLFFTITLNSFSQSANVQSAANYLRNRDWVQAKNFIDLAAANESTSSDPKMWYYRGKIYLAIQTDPANKKLDADAAEKSAVSFINCLKTDKKENFKDDCLGTVWMAGIEVFNTAIESYNNKDYPRAERLYNLLFEIIPLDKDNNLKRNNITPDILNKNLYANARQVKDTDKSKLYLQKLIDAKFNDPLIYVSMERIYLEAKDTAKALSYIEQGRAIFDENATLINEELAIYLAQGNTDVLIKKLTDALDKNPDNEIMYFIRGNLYGKRNETGKSIADYKKALELKPEYFDANYNMGAMYFNDGAEIANKANKLPMNATKEYDEAQKKIKEKFGLAQPYLEKALESNPKDASTLLTLKELYAKTNQLEKSAEMKKRYEALGQK